MEIENRMAVHEYRTRAGATTYKVRFRLASGTQTSETFSNRKSAERFDRDRLVHGVETALAILDAKDREDNFISLGEYATEYAENLSGITEGTRSRYLMIAAERFTGISHLPVSAITPKAVRAWVRAFERQGLSRKTIQNYHGFLSGVMKHAIMDGAIEKNPCVGTRIARTLKKENVYLTRTEFLELLDHIPSAAKNMVVCMPSTGLRWGEITALQVKHVNFEAGTLHVAQSWKWIDGKTSELGPPKTRRSIRTIGLPQIAIDAMTRSAERKGPEDFLFTNPNTKKPWTKTTFQRAWQAATKEFEKTSGKKPRVHDMRHTCAAWMMGEGVPLPVIQRHLGHESIQTTIDVYGHLEPASMLKAAVALDFSAPQFPALER